ncbi:Ig-like domain-containing protein [Humibacter ginsenosidimutans]|uniref:Tandem-95 repeat protein n=1 Tax=Humibacter ginsenosidimutans TaxID=2599293 RepID=A0A5B8M3G3_9MICO|nr:Ig-like domain-containing protein [Humibacter ginsenosidimutans]QDZ14130.1 tandem-95 repeat protein [Humibacter ginsenosidimutans]
MFGSLAAWIRSHKTLASAVAIALVVSVPVGIAVAHRGFPTDDVDLSARDVWVTNGAKLMGGRLNHQIDKLDASVTGAGSDLDVLQDGTAYFLVDSKNGSLERIDPAFVSLVDRVSIPAGSKVAYGASTIAVTSPDGKVWVLDASSRLSYDPNKTPTSAKLGAGTQTVVTKAGVVYSASPQKHELVRFAAPGASGSVTSLDVPGSFQLSSVGDHPVLLDTAHNRVLIGADRTVNLPVAGVQLQQPGEDNSYVLVASGTGLLRVPLGGGHVEIVGAGIHQSVGKADQVSAPVWLNGCAYGAWAGADRYLYACDGKASVGVDIDQQVTGSDLRFRVNHGVIALNNVDNGDSWVVSNHMRLVQNWAELKPNDSQVNGNTGQEKPVLQSFQDTLAHRTKINHQPKAVDDTFGVRAGRSTVLPVLDNDTDQDGDVLTVTNVTPIPASEGRVDIIEGGRAVQLTVPQGVTGGVSFRYSIDDGRGGIDSAQVNATVHPASENSAPVSKRESDATVEVGQSVTYNVLNDWIDPDGDDISLASAQATTDDQVQFQPDGTITFTSKNGQVGVKQVQFTVTDGRASATGTLAVTVKPQGSLGPVATPDFASGVTGQQITIHPLDNDQSPSGDGLDLVGASLDSGPGGMQVSTDSQKQQVTVSTTGTGEYYLKYTLASGAKTTTGLIRVDVADGGQDAGPIAVADDAYVRPGESTTVNPLANDSSPSGRVLAVRSVTPTDPSADLNVELLDNQVVKITSPYVLPKQEQLQYVVSDGVKQATSTITVVPIPPLVVHQPPVAVDDATTVRVGDVTSVNVLDNDSSPDNEPFNLDPKLKDTSNEGPGATAFVSGQTVRYQAPTKPGQYSVSYSISDKWNQTAVATVTFVVTPKNGKDQAPNPSTLTVRAFAGSSVPVTVPLTGIDPDGDSVSLDGIVSQPTLGRIAATTSTSFTYEAYPGSGGTDTFTYKVTDTYGKSATGTVRVGVIPRPSQLQPPVAVNDIVQVKPGRTASVPVLANDSDPNGYTIAVQKKLTDVDPALKASVHGQIVLVQAPQKEGVYSLRYTITNGQGGQDSAYVQVIVTKDAKPVYPTAVDQVLQSDQTAGKKTAKVNVYQDAVNPSDLVNKLVVGLTGPNAKYATVGQDGVVTVRPQHERIAVAYTLTDPTTGLAGEAFIIVPPASDGTPPPVVKVPQQIVSMNGTKSWKLSDIISVPSGRPAKITGASGVSVTHSTVGGYVDGQTLQFTAEKDYRGPAAITFKVNDGREPGAGHDRITSLVLPITVGNPDQSDVAPTFTPPNVQIQAGEQATVVDLRASSHHPNPAILAKLTYTDFSGASGGIVAAPSGSTLSLSAPFGVQPGTTAVIHFKVNSPTTSIDGSVNVKVVSSTKPLAQQKNPPYTHEIQRGQSFDWTEAASDSTWVNPFPGHPLRIMSAKAVSAPSGVDVTYTDTSINVSVGSGAAIGTINIQFNVEDATKDPARTKATIGQYQVIIHDVPAQMDPPSSVKASSGQASMVIKAPADNGKPIDKYEIDDNHGGTYPAQVGSNTITKLTNGTTYTFKVKAHNADGWSTLSAASAAVTPYGKPSAVQSVTMHANGTAPNTFDVSWPAVTNTGGGSVTYHWSFSGGGSGTTKSTSVTTKSVSDGNYSFTVHASNDGGGGDGDSATGHGTIDPTPPPSPAVQTGPDSAHEVTCQSDGGTCHYFLLKGQHFTPGQQYTVQVYCSGSQLSSPVVTADGSGNIDTSSYYTTRKPNCGTYATGYIIIGGVQSATVHF